VSAISTCSLSRNSTYCRPDGCFFRTLLAPAGCRLWVAHALPEGGLDGERVVHDLQRRFEVHHAPAGGPAAIAGGGESHPGAAVSAAGESHPRTGMVPRPSPSKTKGISTPCRPRRPPNRGERQANSASAPQKMTGVGQPSEPYNIKYGVGAYTQFDEIYPTHRRIAAEADAAG